MEIINWLDSISVYTLIREYGYVAWIVIRDILAWFLSIGSFAGAGYLWHNFNRINKGIIEDDTIKVKGSDSNFYMSELVTGTGFWYDLCDASEKYDDLDREDIYRRVAVFRTIWIVFRICVVVAICGFLGAEWGMIGFCLVGFTITGADAEARYYCEKYEPYVNNYDEEKTESP